MTLDPRTEAHRLHRQAGTRLRSGDLGSAHDLYQKLLQLDPAAEHWLTLARIQMALDATTAASESLAAAARYRPIQTELSAQIAQSQFELGLIGDSLVTLRSAAAEQPHHAGLALLLGQSLEDAGQRKEARQTYEHALQLRPNWAAALGGLLRVVREDASVEHVELAERLLADADLPDDERAVLGYGLGRVQERRHNPDAAFRCWRQANRLRRRTTGPLDQKSARAHVDRQIRRFSSDCLAQRPDLRQPVNRRPVFIVGMPRSGTTLLEQILSSHSEVTGYGELPTISRLANRLERTIQRDGEELTTGIFPPGAMQQAVDFYHHELDRLAESPARVTIDKAPLNFFHTGLIATLFPQARIIVCRRDPRDVCLSIYSENFGLEQAFATDLDDLVFFHREYERLIDHWLQLLPTRMREVQYEELVASPESVLRPLLTWLGLDWQAECLEFHRRPGAVLTPSRWQVRSPLYQSSIGRWRNYRDHIGPLLSAFGND